MNYKKLYSIFFFVPLIVSLLTMVVVTGCSDDDEALQSQYGYVQFKLLKSASIDKDVATRATTDKLEALKDAQKVKVVMQYNGETITQTMIVNSYNAENSEFGLRSNKLQLLAGDYSIIGFYLYDKLDQELYAGPAGNDNTFTIVSGGLYTQSLAIDAVERGMLSFKLVKDMVTTRAAEETETYLFSTILRADITVKNLFTQEVTEFKNIRVNYKEDFRDSDDGSGQRIETAYAECDTVVWLKAGSYQISSYSTYTSKTSKIPTETASVKTSKTFVVKDNEKTENVEVPVRQESTAEYIKDYMALKVIWEKMGGKNWSYYGESFAMGVNWNFNKDLDMWGEQPGVQVLTNGRVAYISFEGFGVTGDVPDEIGQFTELRMFILGSHNEKMGGHLVENFSPNMSKEQRQAIRMDYDSKFLARDGREGLSDILKDAINGNPAMKPIKKSNRISTKDVQFGSLNNGITGISRAIMRLTKLEEISIANSPITAERFFIDVKKDSPYYEERKDWSWENMTALLDMEIYNCPKLTALPTEILAELPELQSLNIACNQAITGIQLKDDWETIIRGNSGGKIQILYMGYNNLEEFPATDDLKNMVQLGLLDCAYNKLKTVHPFGKGVNLSKLYLDHNEIDRIDGVTAEDGYSYFCNYAAIESFGCSYNKLTEVPDIFNAKSVYAIGSVDFSHNQISKFENGSSHHGINASTVDLSYNKFTKFPSELFKAATSSSACITSVMLAGNGMTKIEKNSLTGGGARYLKSLDLTYNNLTEVPADDFYASNLPYLYGADLSYNGFSKFPYAVLDASTVTVFALRHQRNAKGERTLREWPTGIYQCPSLRALYMGANDLRKVEDTISPNIIVLDIKDNPNISIDLSAVCLYINAGQYQLIYDRTQDIRGCDALDLEK